MFEDDDYDPLYDPDWEPSEPDHFDDDMAGYDPNYRFGITESEGGDPF